LVKDKEKVLSIIYELLFFYIWHKILIPRRERLINHFLVIFVFTLAFIGVAEVMYWTYKKDYLRAKAKYLRDLIDQKNDLSSSNEPFYTCVYEKWNSGEMPLIEANTTCSLKFQQD
tara:strand:- start:592 stop:939 length:348 start_codon:yes stop_codon:yes gene_type:complete